MNWPKFFIEHPICMDPFLDLIRLLRPQATVWARIYATGRWGVHFRQHHDLLFCRVESGECQLQRPHQKAVPLHTGDFVLVRTSTPFTLTSDPLVKPVESETVVAASGSNSMKLGRGKKSPVALRGGKFVFDTANEQLLTGLLPQLVHVAATKAPSDRIGALLAMNEAESATPGPGTEFVIARLMELLLIEVLRADTLEVPARHAGLLAGLADPVCAQALAAIHSHVARRWTTAKLARLTGKSRSSFSARFARVVGVGPIVYLQQWRIALAKDALRNGSSSIGEIALKIGFQSGSAFSTAFSRAVGSSPKQFAQTARA